MAESRSIRRLLIVGALCVAQACSGPEPHTGPADSPGPVDQTLPTATPPPMQGSGCFTDAQCEGAVGPCSKNVCQDGACTTVGTNAPCDDGDPCTDSDACTAGICQGSPVVCDDGVPCTNDYCWGTGCTSVPSKEEHCALKVVVLEPARGATILGNDPITVSGHVSSPAGPVSSFMVGDQAVTVAPDGSFSTSIEGHRGINVLEVTVEDDFERTDRVLQAFAYGEDAHPPGTAMAPTMIDEGIGLWLDASFFDDDQPDLDDVASLAVDILNGYDLNDALPNPLFPPGEEPQVAFCTWNVDLTDVTHSVGPVDIKPVVGGLSLDLELTDIVGSLQADSYACPDAVGQVFIESVKVEAITSVGMSFQKGLTVDADSVTVSIKGLNIQLEEQSSVFNGVVDWVEEEIQALVAAELEARIPEAILPMIQGMMHGITAYQSTVEIDSPIAGVGPQEVMYRIEPGDLSFNNAGAVLSLRVGVGTLKGTSHPSPGSIVLGSCDVSMAGQEAMCCGTSPGAGCVHDACEACVCGQDDWCCEGKWDALCAAHAANACDASCGCSSSGEAALNLDLNKPVEGYLSEDVVNQLLFAMWWGGQMNVSLGGDALASAVDGVNISDVQLEIDPLLPPVVTTCTQDGGLELQLGDVLANASFKLNGTPASFALYTSVRVALGVTVEPTAEGGGELAIEPNGISLFDYELVTTDGLGAIGEIVIDGMMDTLLQDYLVDDLVTGLAKAYPIPVVDISPWVSGLSAGSDLTLVPQAVTWQSGHLHLGGQVKEP